MTRKAIIVASGPSARGFKAPPNVPIIAVNGAIEWLDRADYWFSLDLSEKNLGHIKNKRPGVQYFAAVGAKDSVPAGVIKLLRIAHRGEEPFPKETPEWWLWRWSAVKGLNTIPGQIHTGNSAWGALGLSLHLGFDDVLLVGVDGTQEERIEGGKCNNLSHLPLLFQSATTQIKLSTISKMEGLQTKELNEWLIS